MSHTRYGIRLTYRCEAHVDFIDDGQELEEEMEEAEEGSHGNKRHRKKRFFDTVAVTPKRRTSTEKFLETTTILWGTEPSSSYGEIMPAGHHSLAFDIRVPQSLPGSFEGRYGFVRHWLECVVDRPGFPEMMASRALSVICKADLNRDPVTMESIRHREEVILCCGCVRPDRYDVTYELPYRGYVPGETMFPDVRIRNFTRNPIHLTAILQMLTTYRAKSRRKMTTKIVVEEKKTVFRAEVTKWEPSLQIPALPPTGLGGCHIIDVRYIFLLEVRSRGIGWQGLAFQDEIKVGTIPLRHVANVRRTQLSAAPAIPPHMALLLDSRGVKSANGMLLPVNPARASSSSTGDGRLTSDAESGTPLQLAGQRRGAKNYQRSASIISNTSHWSFHPMKHGPRHFGWMFGGKKDQRKPNPKMPKVYRC
nr:hypothetical protein BaRGS_035186 [Batillaria attramentaria]